MSIEDRIENLAERLSPQPIMLSLILRVYAPIEDPNEVRPPWFYLGKHATAMFIGGRPGEDKTALRKLRRHGGWDALPEVETPTAIGARAERRITARAGGGNGKDEEA